MADARTGLGFDLHREDPARTLLLGGAFFPGEPGLAGHSDGDVVCHAIADALLGALSLGDIGEHFPEDDPRLAGLAGLVIVRRVVAMLGELAGVVVSCDVTVIAERPAISPRREEIRANLASALGLGLDRVSVKATRPEGLGLTGDGIGCLALATARVP